MKIIFSLLFSLLLIGVKSQTTTYILIRHAEKDTTVKGSKIMQADPPLSKEGDARAKRLIKILKKYDIDSIYSTNFIRTKSTVAPIAAKYKLETKIYEPKLLKLFSEQLLTIQNKTILIVGHSNTTPTLANFLLKADKFKPWDDSVYNKLLIVTIKNGKADVIERVY